MAVEKSPVEAGIVRAKNARQKRVIKNQAPKVVENNKSTIFIKGGNVSDAITMVFKDLHALKLPNSTMYKKKNIVRPFEDCTSLEFFSKKSDASLIAFGSHNKKRPHNLVLARTFDHEILDMVEFGIGEFFPLKQTASIPQATKPILSFAGDQWDTEMELPDGTKLEWRRVRSLLVDFFRGPAVKTVRRTGLELMHSFTLTKGVVTMRTYKVILKKSGRETPRAELEEIGPSMNLTFRRAKLASQQQFGKACKRPAELKAKNVKNIVKDPLTGEVKAKIHMGQQVKQDLEQLNLGHKKVFKRPMPEKEIDSDDEREFEEDIEMEEVVIENKMEE